MVFERLILLFLEFVNSHVGVEIALCVHFLEDLDLFSGLQVMVTGMLLTNHLEVPGVPHVVPILGLEITQKETFPSPFTKTPVHSNQSLGRTELSSSSS